MKTSIRIVWIALACGGVLLAQGERLDAVLHNLDKPFLQATGEAEMSVAPDQAVVDIAVTAEDENASAAAAKNANQAEALLAALVAIVDRNKKLRTISYSVRPNYKFPKPGAAPAISGYIASHVVEATVDDLTQVAGIIDTASRAGAEVRSVQYRLKDPSHVRAELLTQAAEKARANVEAIAAGLGLKLGRILTAEQMSPEPIFGFAKRAAAAPAAMASATPVEAGTIDVSASVMLRVEIAQ